MSKEPTIRIAQVRSEKALDLFVEIAYRLHGKMPFWVPPLRKDVKHLLDRKRHPFHDHAQVEYFLAFRGKKCVGRIAAIENYLHNQCHDERAAQFGFLDAEPDQEVFSALLGAVERWARQRELTVLRGPFSLSTNEECGLLVDRFEAPPLLMTPWNPETYPGLVEGAGYAKAMDLYSYWSNVHTYDPRMERLAGLVRKKFARRGDTITTRPINMSRYSEELSLVKEIYNNAWEMNWGFVPMTDAEINEMAKQMKSLIVPEMVQFVEVNGKPAGFSLCMPDYNVALRHMEGKLGLKQALIFFLLKPLIRQVRVLTLGVKKEFRNRGVDALLVAGIVKSSIDAGFRGAELSWLLEDNLMNRELRGLGAKHYKTHRIYEKLI